MDRDGERQRAERQAETDAQRGSDRTESAGQTPTTTRNRVGAGGTETRGAPRRGGQRGRRAREPGSRSWRGTEGFGSGGAHGTNGTDGGTPAPAPAPRRGEGEGGSGVGVRPDPRQGAPWTRGQHGGPGRAGRGRGGRGRGGPGRDGGGGPGPGWVRAAQAARARGRLYKPAGAVARAASCARSAPSGPASSPASLVPDRPTRALPGKDSRLPGPPGPRDPGTPRSWWLPGPSHVLRSPRTAARRVSVAGPGLRATGTPGHWSSRVRAPGGRAGRRRPEVGRGSREARTGGPRPGLLCLLPRPRHRHPAPAPAPAPGPSSPWWTVGRRSGDSGSSPAPAPARCPLPPPAYQPRPPTAAGGGAGLPSWGLKGLGQSWGQWREGAPGSGSRRGGERASRRVSGGWAQQPWVQLWSPRSRGACAR